MISWLYGIVIASSYLSFTDAFSFNTSTPTQCGQMTIQWDGGQEPFRFILIPTEEIPNGKILNVSIPTGVSQPYSYTFDLQEPAGLRFLASMYDSQGFGTGGTTPILTVGSSDNTTCLESNLLYDFTFSLSPQTSPSQCSSQTITWPGNVSHPVHLFGLIPGGTAFEVPIPQDATTYDWQVNIDDGTQYLLAMADSGQYITGGSSPLITVASGSDNCMNSTSPRSGGTSGQGSTTSSSPSPDASVTGIGGSSSGGNSSGSDPQQGNSGSSSKTGAIVGGTVGGVAFIVLLALLLFCCLRRRARPRRDSGDPIIRSYGVNGDSKTEKRRTGPLDLFAGRGRTLSDDSQVESGPTAGAEYTPSPFRYPEPTEAAAMAGATTGGTGAARPSGETEKLNSPRTPVFAAASTERPSLESNLTRTSNTPEGNSGSGRTGAAATAGLPPSAWSEMGGTDVATVGHDAKPAQGSPAMGARPLPTTPQQASTRFVQHEDSGEVVDLPPRYDQLRARNPDQATS